MGVRLKNASIHVKLAVPTMFAGLLTLVLVACGPTSEPSSAPPIPVASSERTQGAATLPLSGTADVTEQALPSVVRIIAGSGAGTGFIVSADGLVITNDHVVAGYNTVVIHLVDGSVYTGKVAQSDPSLDVAHIAIQDADRVFAPIPIGDSDSIRVGEDVVAIGFPLGQELGLEPTISTGIVSAKRENHLQTDAPLNAGNSGGPLLDMSGQAIGVVVARMERDGSGNLVAGVGFAIPINEVKQRFSGQVSMEAIGTPTPFPTIELGPDVEATKAAIDAVDAHRRRVAEATRTSIEAQQEAARYATSLEATRVAELPTPTPEPTSTPLPTPTPHPRIYCEEWEAMVLEWIKDGHFYHHQYGIGPGEPPDHPHLSADQAKGICITDGFPRGVLYEQHLHDFEVSIGYGPGDLLPGLYEYRRRGDKRVERESCRLIFNKYARDQQSVEMPFGEPFIFQIREGHGLVRTRISGLCDGYLYRIRD